MSADSPVPETSAPAPSGVERERQMLIDAESKGTRKKLKIWLKLSGPGWLQSAITLGGGSLASSLFLGILAGYSLLWLQILAMGCGVVMLGAIGYVTLSTGERPFQLIKNRVNPVLAWGWALATMAANIVWCLPQFSLAEAAVSQNLAPGMADYKIVTCGIILLVTICVTMMYDSGGKGLKAYENLLRIMVGLIVLCFLGVVVVLLLNSDTTGVSLGRIFGGLIPDLSLLSNPAPTLVPKIEATGAFASFWEGIIVSKQRDVMVSAAATAVGINMTFLFPYSLLKKGWDRSFRGLSVFDLATGMAIPFVIATGCVVIAAASRFHAVPAPEIVDHWPQAKEEIEGKLLRNFEGHLRNRVIHEHPELKEIEDEKERNAKAAEFFTQLPEADRNMAAMLADRDALLLANALEPLTGSAVANYVFGFGVLAMAMSTITILMLISGFTFCEVFGFPQGGFAHRVGTLLPAVGALGPFIWSQSAAYLAVPTSVFGMALLPIAYFTFFILMNSKNALGEHRPEGRSRMTWNILMTASCALSTIGAGWAIWDKARWVGVGAVVAFVGLALFVHIQRLSKLAATAQSESAS
jgi:Mn2+/Fe2+ NRAMP family transporter